MTSIGNDIVDLKIINIPRTCSRRFYAKILSPAEQLRYHESLQLPFHYYVWLLWSIKEAAYKCLKQHQADLVFSPTKIEVNNFDIPELTPQAFDSYVENTALNEEAYFKGQVVVGHITLYFRSVFYSDELIHTIISPSQNFENVLWGIKKVYDTGTKSQSAAVRVFLLSKLCSLFSCQVFSIGKSDIGIPIIMIDGQETDVSVSLSHHGDWVGYGIALKKSSMPHIQ